MNYTTTAPKRGWDEVAELYVLIAGRGYIAGGFAAYMASPLPEEELLLPGDIDIFATTVENAWLITQDICKARSWVWQVSPVAYTLEPNKLLELDERVVPDFRLKVQVVVPNKTMIKAYTNDKKPDVLLSAHPALSKLVFSVLDCFDLDIIRALLVSPDMLLVHPNVGQRTAHILHITDPIQNLRRVMKYLRKGVTFSDDELFKLFTAYDALNGDAQELMMNRYSDVSEWPTVDFDDRWFELYPWDRDGGTLILGTELNVDGRVIPVMPSSVIPPEDDIPF